MPFFILAGNLMNSAGITNRIYDFAVATCGWMQGGLGHVNIFGSVIFSGMSGTAIADAAGLGTIEIKAMKDHGYSPSSRSASTAASATLGPIIPPSLPFVIYGMMGERLDRRAVSRRLHPRRRDDALHDAVRDLLRAALRHGPGRRCSTGSARPHLLLRRCRRLMTPAIIIGGMTFGWFTPTEAAIAACTWALILGIFLYRSLSLKQFYKVSMDTIETTAGVLLIVAAASLFGWVLTTTRMTEAGAEALLAADRQQVRHPAADQCSAAGRRLFPRAIASISILVPVLMPIIVKVGIHPVHFGVVMTLNLMIGLLHPPLGMVLFVLVADREDCRSSAPPWRSCRG